MDTIWLVLIALGCGVICLSGGMLLFTRSKAARFLQAWGVPFAAGALLAAAFLDLLPETLHSGGVDAERVLMFVLIGFVFFFVLGYILALGHKHGSEVDEHSANAAKMMIIVDVIHKFVDGAVIGVAFAADARLGLVAALVVVAHELPMEIGDFAVMIKAGWAKRKIIVIQVLQALVMIPGMLIAYHVGGNFKHEMPLFLAVVAGFFIYLAAGEIIPSMQRSRKRKIGREIAGVLMGVILVGVIIFTTHDHKHVYDCDGHDHDHGHSHSHDNSHGHDHDHGESHGHGDHSHSHEEEGHHHGGEHLHDHDEYDEAGYRRVDAGGGVTHECAPGCPSCTCPHRH